jgi:molybdopterin synthase sulfur carrier subunit
MRSRPRPRRAREPGRDAREVPKVSFTPALRRFLRVPEAHVAGASVNEALAAAFALQPALRGYVLDDQGALRRHVNVYVRGEPVRDRTRLSDPVGPDDEIYVLQALTGG